MIEFTKLENEQGILKYDLDTFAASFDHSVPRLFPVWIAHRDGKLVSYCHLRKQMVSYPAVHPSISPRGFYDLCWQWMTKIKAEYGDPLVLMPDKFGPKICAKVGLKPVEGAFYSVQD